jgi:hypothetical protein
MTRAMMLIALTGAAIAGSASAQTRSAYLTIADTNFKVELMATAWGRSNELRRGVHITGLPRTRTTTLSVLLDSETISVVSDRTVFRRRPTVTLTLHDSPGDDTVFRFTEATGLTCDARSRVCRLDFLKIDG